MSAAQYPKPLPLFPIAGPITGPLDMIPIVLDPTGRGERAWQIMRRLKITEGIHAGMQIGSNAPPWMPRLVKLIFGHVDENGRRMLREVFVTMSKKNGKTAFGAALALTKELLEEEQRGFTVLLAENKFQARIAYDGIVAMILADSELKARFEIIDFRAALRYPRSSSQVRAIAADMASVVGFNPSFSLVDELHLLGRTPKGAKLVNQVRTGSVARREPLLVSISTAPTERASGIFQSTMEKARRVISGEEVDPHFFGWICEIPAHLDPEDPANWAWSNPSLGFTLSLDRLIANHASAQSDPEALRDFRSQNLNVMPENSAGEGRWLALDEWDELSDDTLTLEAVIAESVQLYIGVDAGGLDDLSAVFVLGQAAGGRYLGWSHQWLSRRGYEKRKRTNPYDEFMARSELTIFDGGGADIEAIAEVARACGETRKLKLIGIDSYGAAELAEALADCGAEVVSVPQSWKLTPSITWTERRIADGALRHSGSSLLRWNIGNVVVTARGNAVEIGKATVVGAGKIDGVAAMLNAIAACIVQAAQGPVAVSIWDRPELWEEDTARAHG